jgi:hypothetical protein
MVFFWVYRHNQIDKHLSDRTMQCIISNEVKDDHLLRFEEAFSEEKTVYEKSKVMFHFIFIFLLILQILISSKFFWVFLFHIMSLLQENIPYGGDDEGFDGAIDVGVVLVGFDGGGSIYYSCHSWLR